ncbi:hypothetical protein MKW94_017655 [Papaver nudicaule]|uniref:Uncharacterized protein n=1 Tax=Papaver nudicaule TaxID=74823 RepID=A0AA41VQZ1_PAPNU|nr:hypothetical protein [Papaver nudicaule]
MATATLLRAISFGRRESKFPGNWNAPVNSFRQTQIHFQSIRKNTSFLTNRTEVENSFRVKCFLKSSKGFEKKEEDQEEKRKRNPFDHIIQVLTKLLKNVVQKSAIAAVILGLLLTYNPHTALAASGGRIGGRSFSSESESSSSKSSSSSSSSPSYSSPSYPSYSSSSSSSYSKPRNSSSSSQGGEEFLAVAFLFIIVVQLLWFVVALLGTAKSLQKDLDTLAEVADTSTPSGLSHILQESTVAVLRKPDHWISSYSFVDVKQDKEDGEKRFNQLSIEERGKIDEETLVNVDKIKRQSIRNKRASGLSNEYIVVTIMVAAKGVHKLGAINSSANLKEALQKIGSMPSGKILAAEVLWTPQVENDILTERDMLQHYPKLRLL